mgnify:FL=1
MRAQNLADESRRHTQEKLGYEQKIKYLEQENQNIKAQLCCKRKEIESLLMKVVERDKEIATLKINEELRDRYSKLLFQDF